ncbi:MAG: RseA family anti-sigma factor, partial [Steroidobacteraceae bacterium]
MNNEELDSQLSAMLDDELPAPECELLARRLARDEILKARWGRYAAIGACIRSELGQGRLPAGEARTPGSGAQTAAGQPRMAGLHLHGDLAGRVNRTIASEPPLLAGASLERPKRLV